MEKANMKTNVLILHVTANNAHCFDLSDLISGANDLHQQLLSALMRLDR